MEDSRLPIPRQKFKIPIVGRRFQAVLIKKFIQGNHVPIMDRYPNRHTTNNRPPCVTDELTGCNIESRKELYDKQMNKKTEDVGKGNFVKTHLAMSKGARFFRLGEVILQLPLSEIETSYKQISYVSTYKDKTQREYERGLKTKEFLKKRKVLKMMKVLTLQFQNLCQRTHHLMTNQFLTHQT